MLFVVTIKSSGNSRFSTEKATTSSTYDLYVNYINSTRNFKPEHYFPSRLHDSSSHTHSVYLSASTVLPLTCTRPTYQTTGPLYPQLLCYLTEFPVTSASAGITGISGRALSLSQPDISYFPVCLSFALELTLGITEEILRLQLWSRRGERATGLRSIILLESLSQKWKTE